MSRKSSLKVSRAVEEYITGKSLHCAPTTITNDRSVLGRFATGVGNPRIHLLTRQDVERHFLGIRMQPQRLTQRP